MAKQINDEPFSIEVDVYGAPTINPPIQNGYMCWFEYRNGRLCYCCYTPQGPVCYCSNMQILDQRPEDPGPPKKSS